jgi:hypothetical protein
MLFYTFIFIEARKAWIKIHSLIIFKYLILKFRVMILDVEVLNQCSKNHVSQSM